MMGPAVSMQQMRIHPGMAGPPHMLMSQTCPNAQCGRLAPFLASQAGVDLGPPPPHATHGHQPQVAQQHPGSDQSAAMYAKTMAKKKNKMTAKDSSCEFGVSRSVLMDIKQAVPYLRSLKWLRTVLVPGAAVSLIATQSYDPKGLRVGDEVRVEKQYSVETGCWLFGSTCAVSALDRAIPCLPDIDNVRNWYIADLFLVYQVNRPYQLTEELTSEYLRPEIGDLLVVKEIYEGSWHGWAWVERFGYQSPVDAVPDQPGDAGLFPLACADAQCFVTRTDHRF